MRPHEGCMLYSKNPPMGKRPGLHAKSEVVCLHIVCKFCKKGWESMHPSFYNGVFREILGISPQQKAALIGNDAVLCLVFL